jgi:hypothetical protein
MTAAIVFNRIDLFVRLFPVFYKLEHAFMRKHYQKSKFNVVDDSILWTILNRFGILNLWWKQLNDTDLNTMSDAIAMLLSMLYRYPKLRHIEQHVIDKMYAYANDFKSLYDMCQMKVRRILQLDNLESGEYRKTLKLQNVYVAALPSDNKYIASTFNKSRIVYLSRSRMPYEITLTQKIYTRFIEQSFHHESSRWASTHFLNILKFMDHKILPFMTSMLPRKRRIRKYQKLQRDKAFCIPSSHLNLVRTNERHCVVTLDDYQFVINREIYENYRGSNWLVLLYGAVATNNTHPWLRQYLAKHHHRVIRLRFGMIRSDGILLRWTDVQQFLPNLNADTQMRVDITAELFLRKRVSQFTRSQSIQHYTPFSESSVLTLTQLRRFAPVFVQLSVEHRHLFYIVFWNLFAHTSVEHLLRTENSGMCRSIISMINLTMDWTAVSNNTADIRRWIAENQQSDEHDINMLFWRRWVSLIGFCKPSIQVLYLFRYHDSPLFILVQMIANMPDPKLVTRLCYDHPQQESVISLLCRLTERFKLPWKPMDMSLRTNYGELETSDITMALSRILLTPSMRPEIRRVAWHSIMSVDKENIIIAAEVHSLLREHELLRLPTLLIAVNDGTNQSWDDDRVVISCVRGTGRVFDINKLWRVWKDVNLNVSKAKHIFFDFHNEEGMGLSVESEVINHMWSMALRCQHIRVLDDDNTVCVSEHVHTDVYDALFELGFISGLAILKGYHLPYHVHIGWWRHMLEGTAPMEKLFRERCATEIGKISRMSANERFTVFSDMIDGDPNQLTNEDLFGLCMCPPVEALSKFKIGWDATMSHLSLLPVITHLNQMFCAFDLLETNIVNFRKTFSMRCKNDFLFMQAVEQLSAVDLRQLVYFITGKQRLPILQINEEPMKIVWLSEVVTTHRMPKAQNCTHTLLMPKSETDDNLTPGDILKILRPILEFDTVYGFA